MKSLLSLLLCGVFASTMASADEARILRQPDIQNGRIVFVHAGDLYSVGAHGGTAFRLTSHPGEELYPKFSPDGSQIAFSAEYNGTRQVFVMPATGGEPRQLTWYTDVGPMPPRGGTDYRVLDWTPDGRNIVVRMNRLPFDERGGRPYLVPVAGGLETPLAVPEIGGGMLSPDGTKLVYTPIEREFRTWKRYRGGRAQDVWIYDLAANTSQQLTADRATNQQPMWLGETVYFVSDRSDTRLNLWAVSPQGGEPRKLTDFDDYDVLWPSAGDDQIVFEKGGTIWRFDPASGEAAEVPIRIASDAPETQPRFVKAGDFIESFDLAPAGERAVFGARGEVFTVPVKDGEPRNITRTPDAREHSVSWSPDGRSIAYLSDASGEYEIWVQAQDGRSAPRQLTRDGDIWRFTPVWSPDSKKLAYADKRQRLRLVDVASGATSDVDVGQYADITQYVFAPDSRWLVYVKQAANGNGTLWLHALDTGVTRQLSAATTSAMSPAFDPQGRYLYFLSDRDYTLAFSAYEFNWLYRNATRIYAATLAADGPPVYRARSDEVGEPATDKDGDKDDKGTAKAPARIGIDVPGFDQRTIALVAPAGSYQSLSANAEGVFVLAPADDNDGEGKSRLQFLSLKPDAKLETVTDADAYVLAADGRKLLARSGKEFAIIEAKPGADFAKGTLALGHMDLRIEPAREWQQMYVDAWRILRDWFYDPGMHGQDWNAVRTLYQPLVTGARSRADLDHVLQELAGEMNSGHIYVEAGDQPRIERKPGGLLGAELVADPSGYVRIARIFPGANWNARTRSPLTEAGVNVREGEFILAIDNVSTRGVDNVYRLLENKGDRLVSLRVNALAQESGAREVLVRTLVSEQELRYLDWVESRRRLVEQLSNGRIGYIHLPNTAVEGSRELFRGLVAWHDKDALIIDDRYNGGGFIPDRLIELLARTPLNYWKQRGLEPNATPFLSHKGPKAMLINGLSSSGGDALPYYFRKLGLGKLIGTRTWGGLIGLSGNPRLADNGSMLVATFRFLDTNGRWDVEDVGVVPDIEVIDRPELIAAGRDPSIERAVQELMAELEANPPLPVLAPPAPTQFPEVAY